MYAADLRQDMLTLQIFRIMDWIWEQEGLEVRLNPYSCLPTGGSEGLIEVVTQAKTIAHIQKEYPVATIKAAFNKKSLYEWLRKHNNTDEA